MTLMMPPPLGDDPCPDELADLDVAQTLAAAAQAMADQHAAQVRALAVDQHFAVLHASDPQAGRSEPPSLAECKANGWTVPQWERACDKLVQVGGDGTPMVQELPIFELGIARGVHGVTAWKHLADALDLAHRLTGIWTAVREGRGQVWVARKVAAMSRHLDRDQVRVVDAAVAQAWDEAPGRVLTIAEAAILRADPEHARKPAEERARRRYPGPGPVPGPGRRAAQDLRRSSTPVTPNGSTRCSRRSPTPWPSVPT